MESKQYIASIFLILFFASQANAAAIDYKDALMKSILFFEGQRSGKLNLATLRNTWRDSSGLTDGKDQGVDLTGGYYDAGDNVKFGFPMSFSMTLLSWVIIQYKSQLSQAGQLGYASDALKWGTDYLIKCHTAPNEFWGQVGVGSDDHSCWQRPEDMTTKRTAFKIDASNPGSELAGEASAALAAASLVFKASNAAYATSLLTHAKQLFKFASTYRGSYSDSITDARAFYNSWNGYADEIAWAATWLFKATQDSTYLDYLVENDGWLGTSKQSVTEFSWDSKYAGVQILLTEVYFKKLYTTAKQGAFLAKIKPLADRFVCGVIPGNPLTSSTYTPKGLLYLRGVNLQYATNAAFLVSVYADYLSAANVHLVCGSANLTSSQMFKFSQSQIDYILGANPAGRSYMVGFGSKYPLRMHHRGSSIISIRKTPAKIACHEGFTFFTTTASNPNIHTGAIVGGPDGKDNYFDDRSQYNYGETTTYINPGAIGVLAKICSKGKATTATAATAAQDIRTTDAESSAATNEILASDAKFEALPPRKTLTEPRENNDRIGQEL